MKSSTNSDYVTSTLHCCAWLFCPPNTDCVYHADKLPSFQARANVEKSLPSTRTSFSIVKKKVHFSGVFLM